MLLFVLLMSLLCSCVAFMLFYFELYLFRVYDVFELCNVGLYSEYSCDVLDSFAIQLFRLLGILHRAGIEYKSSYTTGY